MFAISPNEQRLKRRTKRACDECHSRRVRCNGQAPCAECHEIGIECTYIRPRHKRGGASAKQKNNYIYRRRLKASERTTAASSTPISSILNQPKMDSSPIEPWVDISNVRYPIVLPVLASLRGIVTASAVCDMLDTYFSRSAWGNSFLVRKSSFLATETMKIRKTKPTLIYAILCFASQHYVGTGLEILEAGRGNVTDRLFELAASSMVSFHKLEDEALLDDVISHIQLASILSSSKYQKKSIEWWSATYQLARQLRLNEEHKLDTSAEEKEERRRTWWLLYCVDRHQALSVRKSLSLRDAESHELLHPCDDELWNGADDFSPPVSGISGITYRVIDCSFFGFFLPLMSTLGEIIELYNIQESGQNTEIAPKRVMIQHHLDSYDESLSECTYDSYEAQLYKCYARHTVSTLHILSAGKWDPLDVLADVEESGLSQDLIYSAAMATIAANTIKEIQLLDAEFDYMPLFFGAFILQCSFPLLLLMKTFGTQSDENIIGGCEIIMEADTIFSRCNERMVQNPFWSNPYWDSFASIIGKIKESKRQSPSPDVAFQTMQDIHTKTREILGLYRWNKTGHGLNT